MIILCREAERSRAGGPAQHSVAPDPSLVQRIGARSGNGRDDSHLAEWRRRVEACRKNGQRVSQWCGEHGIPVSTYYSWKRKGVPGGGIREQSVLRGGFCKAGSGGNGGEYPMWRVAGRHPCGSRHGNDPGNHIGIEVMLNDFKCSCPVYLAYGYTDLRRGIDGLVGMVQMRFQLDPFQNAMFLFCGSGKTGSKGCIGRECCCTSVWKAVATRGRGTVRRRGNSRRSSTGG